MSKGWWHRATTEQRLAQIDAGIELGMTAPQVAMNCGCLYDQNYGDGSRLGSGERVSAFARMHGRQFTFRNTTGNGTVLRAGRMVSRRQAKVEDARNRYLSGEVVDFWDAR